MFRWISFKKFRLRNTRQLSFHRTPDFLEYLIILPRKLFKKRGFFSQWKKYLAEKYIEDLRDNIIGKVHIITHFDEPQLVCDCCSSPIEVSDFIKPLSILVKLPKECVFIDQEHWESIYLKSQISELIDILMYLGAVEVNFKVVNASQNSIAQGVSADVSIYGINVGGDIEVEKDHINNDCVSGKIIFKKPNMNINILYDSDRFHYLPQNHEWQHMVEQRLESAVSNYEIKTFTSEHIYINRSARLSLQKLGIQVKDTRIRKFKLMIEMSATFCEMSPDERTSRTTAPWSSDKNSSAERLS